MTQVSHSHGTLTAVLGECTQPQGPASTLSHLRNRVWFATTGVKPIMLVTEMPPAPWHTLRVDYKGLVGGEYYFHVAYDAYSRLVDIEVTDSTKGIELNTVWGTHGYCHSLVSDNGQLPRL